MAESDASLYKSSSSRRILTCSFLSSMNGIRFTQSNLRCQLCRSEMAKFFSFLTITYSLLSSRNFARVLRSNAHPELDHPNYFDENSARQQHSIIPRAETETLPFEQISTSYLLFMDHTKTYNQKTGTKKIDLENHGSRDNDQPHGRSDGCHPEPARGSGAGRGRSGRSEPGGRRRGPRTSGGCRRRSRRGGGGRHRESHLLAGVAVAIDAADEVLGARGSELHGGRAGGVGGDGAGHRAGVVVGLGHLQHVVPPLVEVEHCAGTRKKLRHKN